MKDKVVVIGGSGFLGSHIADMLTDQGYRVTLFDRHPSPWLRADQHMVLGDLLDEGAVGQCMHDARYVYHLAGIADIGQATTTPRQTMEQNIIGSTIAVEAAQKAGVQRFLFASTVYVYSRQGSFYRVSKQSVENFIEAFHEIYGLPYTILRYGSLYGPRAQMWNGLRRYVMSAVQQRRIVYYGTGRERREFIHVQDAARLTVDALAPEFANQCLTLTGAQSLTSKELLMMINEIMGGDIEIEFQPEKRVPLHYALTPYCYTPKPARKVIPSIFVDIGQGILDLIDEICLQNQKETDRPSDTICEV